VSGRIAGLNPKTILTPLEEREMTSYRLLWFDHTQHIILSKHVECRTDQAAIHLADRQVGDYERLEIWDGKRPVCIGGRPLSGPTLS
jgi:hypothetical protein